MKDGKTSFHISNMLDFDLYVVTHTASLTITTSLKNGMIIRKINSSIIQYQLIYSSSVQAVSTPFVHNDGRVDSFKIAQLNIGIGLPQHVIFNEEWHYSGYITISPISVNPAIHNQIVCIPYHASMKASITSTA
jgi:hypothetical protein